MIPARTKASRPPRRESRPQALAVAILTAEQEQALAERIKIGDPDARQALILANLRLVPSIASDFSRANNSLEFDDLVQEGNFGLMRAAEDFDPEAHGTRFARYASPWIRYYIQRALAEQSSLIRFPYYLVVLRRRYEKTRARMLQETRSEPNACGSVEPTLDEVAERMDMEPRQLKFVRYAQVETRSYSTSALDDDEDDGSQDDSLAHDLPPEAPLETAETMERLHAAMRKLNLLESWVLRRRFRLDDTREEAREHANRRTNRRDDVRLTTPPHLEGRRPYRELSAEIGRTIHQVRMAEQQAIARLRDQVDCPFEDGGQPLAATIPPVRRVGLRRSA